MYQSASNSIAQRGSVSSSSRFDFMFCRILTRIPERGSFGLNEICDEQITLLDLLGVRGADQRRIHRLHEVKLIIQVSCSDKQVIESIYKRRKEKLKRFEKKVLDKGLDPAASHWIQFLFFLNIRFLLSFELMHCNSFLIFFSITVSLFVWYSNKAHCQGQQRIKHLDLMKDIQSLIHSLSLPPSHFTD